MRINLFSCTYTVVVAPFLVHSKLTEIACRISKNFSEGGGVTASRTHPRRRRFFGSWLSEIWSPHLRFGPRRMRNSSFCFRLLLLATSVVKFREFLAWNISRNGFFNSLYVFKVSKVNTLARHWCGRSVGGERWAVPLHWGRTAVSTSDKLLYRREHCCRSPAGLEPGVDECDHQRLKCGCWHGVTNLSQLTQCQVNRKGTEANENTYIVYWNPKYGTACIDWQVDLGQCDYYNLTSMPLSI